VTIFLIKKLKQQYQNTIFDVVGYSVLLLCVANIYFVLGTASSRLTENKLFVFVMATPIM
jgi:hypothetical protein